jgi:hypothetical protein
VFIVFRVVIDSDTRGLQPGSAEQTWNIALAEAFLRDQWAKTRTRPGPPTPNILDLNVSLGIICVSKPASTQVNGRRE